MSMVSFADCIDLFLQNGQPHKATRITHEQIESSVERLRGVVLGQCEAPADESPRAFQVLFYPGQEARWRRLHEIELPRTQTCSGIGPADHDRGACQSAWKHMVLCAGALGHITSITDPPLLAYDLRTVLVEAMGTDSNATGNELKKQLRPKHPRGWWNMADELLSGGVVPELPPDDEVIRSLAFRRRLARARAKREIAMLFRGFRGALKARDPAGGTELIEAAIVRDRSARTLPFERTSLAHRERRLCPEYQPPVPARTWPLGANVMGRPRPPGLDAAELLVSVLAVHMLEANYEIGSSAALPLELVLSDGRPCADWQGWNGHERSVRNRLTNLASASLRLELSLDRDYVAKEKGSNRRSGLRRSIQLEEAPPEEGWRHNADYDRFEYENIESGLVVKSILAAMTPAQAQIARLCLRARELGVPEDQLFQQAGLPPSAARKAKQRLKPLIRSLSAA